MENHDNNKDTRSASDSSKQTSTLPNKSDLGSDLSSSIENQHTNQETHNGQSSLTSDGLIYSEKKEYRPYDPTTPLGIYQYLSIFIIF